MREMVIGRRRRPALAALAALGVLVLVVVTADGTVAQSPASQVYTKEVGRAGPFPTGAAFSPVVTARVRSGSYLVHGQVTVSNNVPPDRTVSPGADCQLRTGTAVRSQMSQSAASGTGSSRAGLALHFAGRVRSRTPIVLECRTSLAGWFGLDAKVTALRVSRVTRLS